MINEKIEADSETGEPGSFGRSINVTDDVLIEVSEEPFSNASQVNISVDGDTYTFIVTDNEWNTYTSEEVCSVDKDTMVSLSVSTYDYYDTYYVAITLDGKVIYNVEVNPDEETGEPGSKSFTFKASGDVVITISTEKIEVETVRTLTINVDTNVFEISDSNWNTYNSGDVIELTEESYYFTITTYDYYDTFYVTITVDGEVLYNTAVSPDEETGEPGSKSFLVGVTGDVVISVSTTSK